MKQPEHKAPRGDGTAQETNCSQDELAGLLRKVQETNKALARANVESAQVIYELQEKQQLLRDELIRYNHTVTKVEAHLSCAIESLQGSRDAYGKVIIADPAAGQALMMSVEQQLILASDILDDMNGLEKKQGALTCVADLKQQMLGVLQRFQSVADEKGMRLNADFAVDLPNNLWLSLEQLEQATGELLHNALKHSQAALISLEVKYNPDKEGVPALEVVVVDNGRGVTEETVQHLRDVINKKPVENTNSSRAGVGYPLLSRLIDVTDGELDIQSSPSHGFKATLRMPACAANKEFYASKHGEALVEFARISTESKLHLALLVHTGASAGEALGEELKNLQCQVLKNWQETTEFITNKSLRPACLLLQGKSTLEVMGRLLQEFNLDKKEVCSLYLAGPKEKVDVEQLRVTGVSGLVRLPIEEAEMRKLIDGVWKRMSYSS